MATVKVWLCWMCRIVAWQSRQSTWCHYGSFLSKSWLWLVSNSQQEDDHAVNTWNPSLNRKLSIVLFVNIVKMVNRPNVSIHDFPKFVTTWKVSHATFHVCHVWFLSYDARVFVAASHIVVWKSSSYEVKHFSPLKENSGLYDSSNVQCWKR